MGLGPAYITLMKMLVLLSSLVLASSGFYLEPTSCDCPRQHKQIQLCADNLDTVFKGRVIDETPEGRPETGEYVYRIQLTRDVRDPKLLFPVDFLDRNNKQLVLRTSQNPALCGFKLNVNEHYIFAANYTHSHFTTRNCSGTELFSPRRRYLTQVMDVIDCSCEIRQCEVNNTDVNNGECLARFPGFNECVLPLHSDRPDCDVTERLCIRQTQDGACDWDPPRSDSCPCVTPHILHELHQLERRQQSGEESTPLQDSNGIN